MQTIMTEKNIPYMYMQVVVSDIVFTSHHATF